MNGTKLLIHVPKTKIRRSPHSKSWYLQSSFSPKHTKQTLILNILLMSEASDFLVFKG